MKVFQQFPLTEHNSFAISAICPRFYAPQTLEELNEIFPLANENFYILGEGSNTLFIEENTPIIIHPDFAGIQVQEFEDSVLLTASCGENWHQLVCYCLAHGYHGIENLALIPGSVGAAPVQNIGAYGVEIADVVECVTWYEFSSQQLHTLTKAQCQFSYRDSIFKNELAQQGLIISVTLRLSKQWQAKLSYQGLDQLASDASAAQVVEQVIALRQSKLPDPQKLPNCGSFFKNPIVTQEIFAELHASYPNMPYYRQGANKVKLAAGWLIDQCGLKGYRQGRVGVHQDQALVLVNYQHGNGSEIYQLASYVRDCVASKFSILLEPEVRMIAHNGLTRLQNDRAQDDNG